MSDTRADKLLVAALIDIVREERDMTKAELASYARVEVAYVSRITNRGCTFFDAIRVFKALEFKEADVIAITKRGRDLLQQIAWAVGLSELEFYITACLSEFVCRVAYKEFKTGELHAATSNNRPSRIDP